MKTDSNTAEWKGTFDLYQCRKFANIIAKHSQSEMLDLNGLLVLFHKHPFLGLMGGILGSPEIYGECERWWPQFERLRFSYLNIYSSRRLDLLTKYCVSPSDHFSMLLDLSLGEDALLSQFNRTCRQPIRQAVKRGVSVKESRNDEELKCFYEICLNVSDHGRRFSIPPYPLLEEIFHSSFGKLFIGIVNGTIIGGLFFLLSCHMQGWVGGFNRKYSHFQASNLMHFEAMCWGIKNGFRYYNLGDQSCSELPGITKFKMSFNPTLYPSYHYLVPKSRTKIILTNLKKRFISMISRT